MQNIAPMILSTLRLSISPETMGKVLTWVVFVGCFLFSAAGVALSFLLLGSTITGVKMWGAGLLLSVVMLGVSYGAKYAGQESRQTFTPLDIIQYLSQGFLWPATWPALASAFGVQKIEPPQMHSALHLLRELLAFVF